MPSKVAGYVVEVATFLWIVTTFALVARNRFRSPDRKPSTSLKVFASGAILVGVLGTVAGMVLGLIQDRAGQVVIFSVAGLALLLGKVFLTGVIIPIVKGVPSVIFGIFARSWWEKRQKSKTPPTSKPVA